jgi:DnaJ-class molecular chaperone
LDRTEAFFGVSLPIEVPVYGRCDRCGGSGGDRAVCASCHDTGWPKRVGPSRSKSLQAPEPASATRSI